MTLTTSPPAIGRSDLYDAIIIGGGPLGQATAYSLGRRGARSLLIEQFTFGNQLGSSSGVSRQFRLPYPQQYMVKLVKQSIPFWDELQALTPVQLRDKVGTLWFGDPAVHSTEGNIAEAEKALTAEGVPYEMLDAKGLECQYHFRNLPSTCPCSATPRQVCASGQNGPRSGTSSAKKMLAKRSRSQYRRNTTPTTFSEAITGASVADWTYPRSASSSI